MHPVMYKNRNPEEGKCRVVGNATIKLFYCDGTEVLCIVCEQAYEEFYPPGSVHWGLPKNLYKEPYHSLSCCLSWVVTFCCGVSYHSQVFNCLVFFDSQVSSGISVGCGKCRKRALEDGYIFVVLV